MMQYTSPTPKIVFLLGTANNQTLKLFKNRFFPKPNRLCPIHLQIIPNLFITKLLSINDKLTNDSLKSSLSLTKIYKCNLHL